MLKLENIFKDYEVAGKPFPALKGVSFDNGNIKNANW